MSDFDSMRREYTADRLRADDLHHDPLETFDRWLAGAEQAGVREPNAMALATCGPRGPACRIVLLKGRDDRGLRFFTNYDSRKGADLAHDPRAAVTFWWAPLERQVRLEGTVERLDATESDEYFAGRPRATQLGAWASRPQSGEIPDRETLERRLAEAEERFPEGQRAVERPPFWGGYRLVPTVVEFWQGREHRLHDRLCCRREQPDGAWQVTRLSP